MVGKWDCEHWQLELTHADPGGRYRRVSRSPVRPVSSVPRSPVDTLAGGINQSRTRSNRAPRSGVNQGQGRRNFDECIDFSPPVSQRRPVILDRR